MARTVSITSTPRPHIAVIQQTYRTVFTPTEVAAQIESDWPGLWLIVDDTSLNTQLTLPTEPTDDWLKFLALVRQWRNERGAMSSITEAAVCPAYQSIIGMGYTAVPFLIAQLQSEGDDPDQWFWALKAITGADPVAEADRGDFRAMAKSWIEWAQREGYAR